MAIQDANGEAVDEVIAMHEGERVVLSVHGGPGVRAAVDAACAALGIDDGRLGRRIREQVREKHYSLGFAGAMSASGWGALVAGIRKPLKCHRIVEPSTRGGLGWIGECRQIHAFKCLVWPSARHRIGSGGHHARCGLG